MGTICVEMNVWAKMSNAMALALKTQPFVQIDASMRKQGIKSIKKSHKIDANLVNSCLLTMQHSGSRQIKKLKLIYSKICT